MARPGADLIAALSILPEYLRTAASRDRRRAIDYRDWGIPLGRRFRALKLWFTLRLEGITEVQAMIRVTDSGIGMDESTQARIFDDFAQADSSTTRRFGGTGLGLSISRQLCLLMGGSIRVTSMPGHGSSFEALLPLPADDPAPAAPKAWRRAVVLEPHDRTAEVLSQYLAQQGYSTIRLRACSEFRDWLDQADPVEEAADILLLGNVSDPDDASGCCEPHVIRRASPLPAILLTSMDGKPPSTADLGHVQAGAWLSKPVRRSALRDALRRALTPQDGTAPASLYGSLDEFEPSAAPRILLVEDHPVNVIVAEAQLHGLGCSVTIATDGRDALEIWERERLHHRPFDAVLMDWQMPVMDGLDATRALRKQERLHALPRTPVVALTANAMQEDREQCLSAGMDDHLPKPIDRDQLAAVLSRWIPRRPLPQADRQDTAPAPL